jgi:hypothetical protein
VEVLNKPRMFRILNGTTLSIEQQVADLGNDYAVTAWHFYNDGPVGYCTAVAVHQSVLRQMQIAQAGMPMNGMRR